jgi:energy-coupling factor transporter ATP-binding protein EcfA2
MKNRLELFRSQIAAFDGAADPMNAISKGYFIEEPHQSSTNALFKRISLRPQSKILLIGGIGSGKTTQLLRLQQIFQKAPDTGIYPHYIDVTEYTKPNDLQVGTLDAIVALELVTLLERNGCEIDEDRKTSIQQFAYGYTVTERRSNEIDMFSLAIQQTSRRVPGILNPRRRSTDSLNSSSQIISGLLENFKTKLYQMPYFLFDGLDRVDEAKKFISMASSDLQNSEIGFTIVGAASFLYTTFANGIDNVFNHTEYRSAFDVDRDEEAYTFFERVLLARSGEDFFQKDAIWQQFDYARSRFSHDKGGIILLTPNSAAQFQTYAPNFASWIGSDESRKPAEIIGFDFEIRFPEPVPIKFFRFDLNLPGHDNQTDGLRFHLHPSSEDFMVHSPPMSPLEILHMFLYGFEIPQKMRR